IASVYDELLSNTSLTLPKVGGHNFHAYYIYVCRHPERDKILQELKKQDINLNISYPWPIHTMPVCNEFNYCERDLPDTEKAAKDIFSLLNYPEPRKEMKK